MVDGVEQPKFYISFCVNLVEWSIMLLRRATTFLIRTSAGCFQRFSYTRWSWEYKSVLCVWWRFKNSKWITHYTDSINFLPSILSFGVIVKALDCRIVWVRTPVALLRSLSNKYTRERFEPSDPPIYGLNSSTTVLLKGWIRFYIIQEVWFAIK